MTAITTDGPETRRELRIDLLSLDLSTCTRCLGADRSLEAALERVGDVLRAAGVDPEVNRVRVESAEHARALRFVSSPTIRVDGEDVAVELRESPCGAEACTDGCGADTACRLWAYRGAEYTEPPVEMIVDAILRRVYGGVASAGADVVSDYDLPENLERFFAGRSSSEAACCR